jgi:predicted hydrocarbon binding protein
MTDFQSSLMLDPQLDDVRSSLTGSRMVILSADAFRSLEDGLYKKFSTGASVIILEMGISYGSRLFDILDKKAKTSPDADPVSFRNIMQILFNGGVGKISFSGDLDSAREMTFTVSNCAFCGRDAVESNCNLLRGMLTGLMNSLYRKQHKSNLKCSTENGNHFCKIDLTAK